MKISQQVRKRLRRPLGKLETNFDKVVKLAKAHRTITVGDICTTRMLAAGVVPHLAVFDYRFMRQELDEPGKRILAAQFKKPTKFKNPPGTLSEELLRSAAGLIEAGGGVLIDGEEDLTALAFILHAKPGDIVVYGQPNEGAVVVRPTERIRKEIRQLLAKP